MFIPPTSRQVSVHLCDHLNSSIFREVDHATERKVSAYGTQLSDPEYWPASCYTHIEAEKPMAGTSRKIDTDLEGPETAGQSGDTQGLSNVAEADSESVAELVEEGQFFEAGVISGVENAPDADVSEVKTREVPEDDVPLEYLEQEQERPSD